MITKVWRSKLAKSLEGNINAIRNRIYRNCSQCKKEFYTYINLDKKGYGKFCSHECYSESIKGNHSSPETEFKKGMTSWLKGKKMDRKLRRILSLSHGGTGNSHENSLYPEEFYEIREYIRKRDNYQCKKCGITEEEHLIVYGKELSVHHINYNKKNCNKHNLITLCNECNLRVNYNRKYWTKHFQSKIGVL